MNGERRVRRAEDEPKCEALRLENTALMEQVITYKEKQMGFLQDVEGLKQEKAALVSEKVRPDIIFPCPAQSRIQASVSCRRK